MRRSLGVVIGLWFGLVVACFAALWTYANRPGELGYPVRNASTTALHLDQSRHTLVVFVHPRCPCTVATVEQIARLQRKCRGLFTTRIVAYRPSYAEAEWSEGAVLRGASRLVDCEIIDDPDAAEALEIGAQVSGTAALYAPDGTLRFWGGLTPQRGHAGDSLGLDAVAAILRGERLDSYRAPTFGCSLVNAGDCAQAEACVAGEGCCHDG